MGDEQCLRFGADNPAPGCATILFIPPLFDESNRLRRTLVLTMRALAARGHVALLPDLPGQNDSILPNASATMAQWRDAIAALCAQLPAPFIIASWRGGALLDDAATGAAGWWRMAPQGGASLVKMMMRTRIAGDKESGRTTTAQMLREQAQSAPVELAGYHLCASMIDALDGARPVDVAPLRTVAIGAGAGQVPGTALWLRAEPGEDAAMAQAMAADIAEWSVQCAAG